VKQHLQGVRLEKLHTLVFHIWQECSRNKDKVVIFSLPSSHLFVWKKFCYHWNASSLTKSKSSHVLLLSYSFQ
jgi:transposase